MCISKTLGTYGGIDILVCNAGINPYHGPMLEVSKTTHLWLISTVLFYFYSDQKLKTLYFQCPEEAWDKASDI